MITPRFKLTQDDDFVTINIRAPYCSLRELDIDIEEDIFLFVCKPYYLRLSLPGKIVDDARLQSTFDTDSGEFSYKCPKMNRGEHFKDLDLITKLLVSRVEASYNDGSLPIEILSESEESREVISEKPINAGSLEYGFGFGLRAHKDFVQISAQFDEVFAIDPCKVGLTDRRKLRLQYEQGKFNIEHYLADFIENEEICELIKQTCPFLDTKDPFSFTDKELDFLKDLPNIQYNLSLEQITFCFNGLIDILFAYCYDQRTTNYEGSVESGWNITKLAATLNWLDVYQTPKEAVITAFRRSVIYPLYRHFDLAQTVFDDVKQLIKLEEKYIIKVLIHIYDILLREDCGRYILNNLFIKDYIIYLMKWDSNLWKGFVSKIMDLKIMKEDLGLNLVEIETGYVKDNPLAPITIRGQEDDDSDDDSYGSSSEDSSDDSSSSEYTSDSGSDNDEDSLVIRLQQTVL